jgi:hypothetical protein
MVAWKVLDVKNYLLVIRMDVAAGTQWGSSWAIERVCGRGGIRKVCEKVFGAQEFRGKVKSSRCPDPVGVNATDIRGTRLGTAQARHS